jgi:hypothetical protein
MPRSSQDLPSHPPVTTEAASPGPSEGSVQGDGGYRIALRPDDDAEPDRMDDIVVLDVKMFRAEQMDAGEWWVCLYLDDTGDQMLTFAVSARCRPRRIDWTVTERPTGEHIYEGSAI